MRGIQEKIEINFNGETIAVNPGLVTSDVAMYWVSCRIPFVQDAGKKPFSVQLDLNGSDEIQFVPVDEQTSVTLNSDSPSPSFSGAFLPDNRSVGDDGFTAMWNVLHLNRNSPHVIDSK